MESWSCARIAGRAHAPFYLLSGKAAAPHAPTDRSTCRASYFCRPAHVLLRAKETTISGELAAPVDAHVEVGQTSRQERPPAPRRSEHRLDHGQSMRRKAAVSGSEGQQGHTMGPGAHLDRHVGQELTWPRNSPGPSHLAAHHEEGAPLHLPVHLQDARWTSIEYLKLHESKSQGTRNPQVPESIRLI